MDRITIIIRDAGKVIKADFDGEGKCISGNAEAIEPALEILAYAATEVPSEPSIDDEFGDDPADASE